MRRALIAARGGLTAQLRRKRARLGKKITQWRKSEGKTAATAGSLVVVLRHTQDDLAAARCRIRELEGRLAALEGSSSGEGDESSDAGPDTVPAPAAACAFYVTV